MRQMRKASHEDLNARACDAYNVMMERSGTTLASRLIERPREFDAHFRSFAASINLGSLYGLHEDDADVEAVMGHGQTLVTETTVAITPGSYLVEFFPWMLYLPEQLATWKRHGRSIFDKSRHIFGDLLDRVEARVVRS